MANYAILGASDPEMSAIETLLRECGVRVIHATTPPRDGEPAPRVHPGNAYAHICERSGAQIWHAYCADTPAVSLGLGDIRGSGPGVGIEDAGEIALPGASVLVVETVRPRLPAELFGYGGFVGPAIICTVADHHRPGDRGFGRPPSEFMGASSLGQVISWLARRELLPSEWEISGSVSWFDARIPGSGEFACDDHGQWCVGVVTEELDTIRRSGVPIPRELVLTAAADHCLGAAYRGECPGVDPDALLEFRIEQRAQFQGVSPDAIRASISAAREELQAAEVIPLLPEASSYDDPERHDACVAADMRGPVVPELPEAATRDGMAYIAGPLVGPDGRSKFTCSGTAEVVEAFMRVWGPANGLTDIYGDPARGFAGGYAAGGGTV